MEYSRLKLIGINVIAAIIVRAYDENNRYASTSVSQTDQTKRLQARVLKTNKTVAYVEVANLCLKNPKFNKVKAPASKELKQLADCRSYSTFLHTLSLKSAT